MDAIFFAAPDDFRQWLLAHHEDSAELWVGFYKKHTGKPSITWSEAVDQALCFGWIDGIRKTIDADSYRIRFTPRKAGSNWSAINLAKVAALTAKGLMQPAGLKIFEERDQQKAQQYSYEQQHTPEFSPEYAAQFQANAAAWEFFQVQSATYKKSAVWWVMSAKQEQTQQKRLAIVIEESAQGRRAAQLIYTPKK